MRPNYFVGIQFSNPNIHKNIKALQESIVKSEPSVYSALIPTYKLHLTLAVTFLKSDEDIKYMSDMLEEWGKEHLACLQKPIVLTVAGVGSFGKRVVFANLKHDNNLKRIFKFERKLKTLFHECGFYAEKKKFFNPHITILKFSNVKGVTVNSESYSRLIDELKAGEQVFGYQTVQSIQLLSMNKKDETGYYFCSKEIYLNGDYDRGDHAQCCTPRPIKTMDYYGQGLDTTKETFNIEKGVIRRKFHSQCLEFFEPKKPKGYFLAVFGSITLILLAYCLMKR